MIPRTPDVRERSIFLCSCVASRIRGPWIVSDRVISDFLCSQGMLQVWCNRRRSMEVRYRWYPSSMSIRQIVLSERTRLCVHIQLCRQYMDSALYYSAGRQYLNFRKN